ncbi:MAG: substrate-binding domain-containing protein [Candidatus Bathyarchaeia archaeon]
MNKVFKGMDFAKTLTAKIALKIRSGETEGFSEKDAELFKAIKNFGSISMAAKNVGEDYRLAWKRIDLLEKAFKCKLVERSLGGVGGGGAKLTVEAEVLLQKYLLAEKRLKSIEDRGLLEASLKIYGSHCPALETLVEQAEERFKNFFVEYISVGSMEGLKLVVGKYADLSGIHLYDERTGKYNIFLFEDSCIGEKIAIIRGYKRIQGIVTRRGNPKNICSIEDLLRKDIVFVNRNRGSGTRLLLDNMLKEVASKRGQKFNEVVKSLRGYGNEVRSHMEVGVAVKDGKADCGISIKYVARTLDLEFIPLKEEVFDFVILKENVGKGNIQKFIETLSSREFKDKILEKDIGINFFNDTGKILTRA